MHTHYLVYRKYYRDGKNRWWFLWETNPVETPPTTKLHSTVQIRKITH